MPERPTSPPPGISQDLWDLLACPCPAHGAVVADLSTGDIVATCCGRRFQVRDGIPVMLLDQATLPST